MCLIILRAQIQEAKYVRYASDQATISSAVACSGTGEVRHQFFVRIAKVLGMLLLIVHTLWMYFEMDNYNVLGNEACAKVTVTSGSNNNGDNPRQSKKPSLGFT